jgi:DNA polymerase alpha subunit A
MIATGTENVELAKTLGNEMKKDVNKSYKTLEIEIDGIFLKMLLLKKKNYAALVYDGPGRSHKEVCSR